METLKKIGYFFLLFIAACAVIGSIIAAIVNGNFFYIIAAFVEGICAVPTIIWLFKKLMGEEV